MSNKKQQITTLVKLNDELENYFRNTIIPQLFVDADLLLRKFTPPAMKQFKLKEEHIGKSISDIKDNFRFPSIIDNIEQVIATGNVLEKEIQTTDMRWYQMNILPYHVVRENRPNGVIITFVDITARVRDLKEQEKLIVEHELLLDTISHDIKTPLTSLGLTIEMLGKIPDNGMAKFPVLLEKIENSLRKLKDIIFELTDSRRAEHRYHAVREIVDFEHIIEDVRLSLAPQILETGAKLETRITHSEVVFVRRKLRSLIYNLINNSIKYRAADRKPKISITAELEGDYYLITVVDNGQGIAKENLQRIFNKYERIYRKVEGTGVGLHLVKQIVDLSGGKITVESEPGLGSTFKVFLKCWPK